MGLIKDTIKARVYGSEIRGAIREAKGGKTFSEGLREDLDRLANRTVKNICDYCGSYVGKEKIKAKCKSLFCNKWLCSKCTKRCKKCGKLFCPAHIKKHKCK